MRLVNKLTDELTDSATEWHEKKSIRLSEKWNLTFGVVRFGRGPGGSEMKKRKLVDDPNFEFEGKFKSSTKGSPMEFRMVVVFGILTPTMFSNFAEWLEGERKDNIFLSHRLNGQGSAVRLLKHRVY